ncbi:MAG: hypothetical protein PHF30_01085 [Bacilli bacterium]|nr:hypothetical protein [Bacilli bacterium]
MNKLRKINKLLKIIITISLFLLVIALSYAYFTAQIIGSESSTTITVGGGTMNITFAGGSNITMSNIYPKATAWGTKNFTVTGNNTTALTMYYNLTLVVTTNTFISGTLKYSLTSTNTGSNGTVAPSATMKTINTGTSSILLGNGTFIGPTIGDKVHSYTLDFYFPDTGVNQNENQGKTFNAYVKTEEGIGVCNECLNTKILEQYGGASSITEAPAGTFASISGSNDNLMYKMDDDYGTSYYFRGAKDYINNNIIFGGFQWKIVRINGDGTIRLIYNGICPDNNCTINSTGTSTQMGTSAFNPNDDDNKYIGYMYGGAAGVASTSRAQATTNETNSTIKTYLDTWYSNNLSGTDYKYYISDTLFCNDRQLESEIGGPATGTGFGASDTDYAALYRLITNKTPNIKCGLKNDRFTVDETTIGNGVLTYPIGLLTADEASIAGLVYNTSNTTNYLYTNEFCWSLTPVYYYGGAANYLFNLDIFEDGYPIYNNYGVRGVLNLKSDTLVIGTGTVTDPYVVQ